METIMQWARALMFFIDNIVYSLISSLYELIIYLANLDLRSNNSVFDDLVGRIYLLLGIFMLFKVAFSMIQYLIDPNSFSDSAKGFGKLVTNLLVAIVLLVSVPFIFEKAYELQGFIIEDNTINRLILGQGDSYVKYYKTDDEQDENTATSVRQMAVDVQFTLFSAFYTLNTREGDTSAVTACKPDPKYRNSNVIGSADMVNKDGCLTAFAQASAQEMHNYGAQLTDFFKTADDAGNITDKRKFESFGKLVFWKIGGSGSEFTINYTPIISTLVGGYLVLLLLAYAIDIAARAIKLMFLQMIAPIAIVSYIDPKESVSNGKLNAWIKESLSTYVSLFLRLAIVFLAIRLVAMLTSMLFLPVADAAMNSNNSRADYITYYNYLQPEGTMNMFVYVFLVLGIFSFAKEFPKMLEKIFGISGSGNLYLNPFKNNVFTGAAAVGLAGAGALAANALAAPGRLKAIRNKWREGGGLAGHWQGVKDSWDTFGRNFSAWEPLGHNETYEEKNADIKAGRALRRENLANLLSGKTDFSSYRQQRRDANDLIRQSHIEKSAAKIEMKDARAKDRQELKDSARAVGTNASNIVRPVVDSASTIAGIAAGAASAGARAAQAGAKASSPSAVRDAAKAAREASNAARAERDSQSDMARDGRYTATDRIRRSIDTFAGVKGDKSYGVGKIGDEIKDLKNEIVNMERRRLKANEQVAEALSNRNGITNGELMNLFKSLDSARSADARGDVISNINNYITNNNVSSSDVASARQYIAAVQTVDDLTSQHDKLQKQLKQLEDVTNLNNPKS